MSDNDYFEQLDDDLTEEKPTPKTPKKKRVLSDEQKKKNIENLRRGREKALANRKIKAEIKKLEKQKVEKDLDSRLQQLKGEVKPVEEKVNNPIETDKPKATPDDDLMVELKRLRDEVNLLKVKPEASIKPADVPVPNPEKVNTVIEQPPKIESIPDIPFRPQFVPISKMLNTMYNI